MSVVFSWTREDPCDSLLFGLCCPRCDSVMTFHQPDPQLPERLLATCDACKSWYLSSGKDEVLKSIAGPSLGVIVDDDF